jgi:hypothetical protein
MSAAWESIGCLPLMNSLGVLSLRRHDMVAMDNVVALAFHDGCESTATGIRFNVAAQFT